MIEQARLRGEGAGYTAQAPVPLAQHAEGTLMARVKPAQQPGFQSQATQVQATGSWFAGNLVRWRMGLLEKVGGWMRLVAGSVHCHHPQDACLAGS